MTSGDDVPEIDRLVQRVLTEFREFIVATGWRGREREAVSLFAFKHLVPACAPGAVLHDPAQIGIEVPVPQVTAGGKSQVAKDLVIWPAPHMTVWGDDGNPSRTPAVVMEWKSAGFPVRSAGERRRDRDRAWLRAWTAAHGGVGYSVGLLFGPDEVRLATDRVVSGSVDLDWLRLP